MASVSVIWEGYFRWVEKLKSCDVTANSVLVEAAGKKIIVDVPNVGEEREYLEALKKHGIDPLTIETVVVTHEHPDHVGCLHLFPNAWYYGSGVRWKGARHEYWPGDRLELAPGVTIVKTPGHTPNDCSVFVETADGVVAMAGDLWVWTLDDPRNRIVNDKEKLRVSREMIAKTARWIIPGHGPRQESSKAVY
jgi:glyoxylase-like metal-dependent hydrolase (beta-lactamase superfamily II)